MMKDVSEELFYSVRGFHLGGLSISLLFGSLYIYAAYILEKWDYVIITFNSFLVILVICIALKIAIRKYDSVHKTDEREKYDRDLKYGTVAVIICLSYPFLILSFRPTTWFDEVAYWICVSEVSAFTVSSLFVLNSIHKCYYFEKKSVGVFKCNICLFQLVSIIAITINPYGPNCYATRFLMCFNFLKNVFIISELSGFLYLFWGDSFIKPKYGRNLEKSEELENFEGIIECSTRELECQMCRLMLWDTINERIPMLLTGCGHSFCSECVEKLRERNRSVKCLFCRTSSGGKIQKNWLVIGIIQEMKETAKNKENIE